MRPPSRLPSALYKKVLDHIHPQLPLSVRDSNRLLGVLKNTFHRQLDLEHPFPDPSSASTSPSAAAASPRFVQSSSATQPVKGAKVSSHVSASQHLDAVLAHPLLGGTKAPNPSNLATHLEECAQACRRFQHDSDKHIATRESATTLLCGVLDRASLISGLRNAREFIKQSHVTNTVLKYLRSTHNLTPSSIKENPELFEALIKCLAAEGRHVLVERWIFTARSPGKSHDSARTVDTYSRRWLLDILLRAETQLIGLETSAARFSRRIESLERFCMENEVSTDEESNIVQPALTALTQSLTDARNGTPVSREVYDTLISSLGNPASDSPYLVHLARLKLYHPTHPDATSMLDLLQTLDPVPAPAEELWRVQLRTLVQWAVDASKLLSRQGNAEPAAQALQFAKRMCAAAQVDWDELLQTRLNDAPFRVAYV